METIPDFSKVTDLQGLIVAICTTVVTIIMTSIFVVQKLSGVFKESSKDGKDAREEANSAVYEAEKRVMDAMQQEAALWHRMFNECQMEHVRREKTISMIIDALKIEGLSIIILEDRVSIRRINGKKNDT